MNASVTRTFDDDLFGPSSQAVVANAFAPFGLARNPFPGHEEEFFAFVHNQQPARDSFRQRFEQFRRDGTVNTLLVTADHRVGKTNFLRHFHSRLLGPFEKSLSGASSPAFCPFYTRAYEYDFFFLYQQIVEAIPTECFLRLVESVLKTPVPGDFPETDLRRALDLIANKPPTWSDNLRDKHAALLRQWLRGGARSLTKDQRQELGVNENVSNSPVGSRFLHDLLDLMHKRGILAGMVLFLDEFERLAGPGLSRSQRDRYLNDLRNFISDFQRGAFFLFAMTPLSVTSLQNFYPAIVPRLGTAVHLAPLRTEGEAIDLAKAYVEFFRIPGGGLVRELLSTQAISLVFLREKERLGGSVPHGTFLTRLREEADKAAY